MPTVEKEIQLIEAISQSQVIAIALNHENLTSEEILTLIEDYEGRFHLPTTDVLNYGCQKLIQALSDRFPNLNHKITQRHLEKMPLLAVR
jgi:uncharacterized NAD-dependent epimerase/dehydratase family protein